jgi:hypothetical protein
MPPQAHANPAPKAPLPAKTTETVADEGRMLAESKTDPWMLRAIHGQGFSGIVLRGQYEDVAGNGVQAKTAQAFTLDVAEQMKARDPLERMLIDQMIWTHVRIGRLSRLATQQNGLKQVQVVNEATDKALNAFRRQMLALQEYRSPRPAPSFTAISQQNIALMNGSEPQKSQIKNVTNEKETGDVTPQTKALPADTGSVGLPADLHPAHQAVAVGDRAQDGGG